MSTDPTCPRVSNLLLLDSEGKRIAVKYFDENKYAQRFPSPTHHPSPRDMLATTALTSSLSRDRSSVTAQGNYEKSVFAKTSRTNARGEGALLVLHVTRQQASTCEVSSALSTIV